MTDQKTSQPTSPRDSAPAGRSRNIPPLVWIVATLFRRLGLPPVFLLATGTAVVGVCSLLLMFLAPATFLGSDGQWMVTTLRSFVQKTTHPAAQPSGTPAVS